MPNKFEKQLKKNRKYWKKRFEILEESAIKKGADYYESLDKQYRVAEKRIESQISTWYQRFAYNNNISLTEARRLLNSSELEEFKWSVEEYIKHGQQNAFTQEWMKELENASAKVHISRLESLKLQMQQELEVLYGNQLDGVDKLARDIYTDNYYHTAFEIQKGFNVGWNLHSLDNRLLDKVISKPWTADGRTFSDKLWTQKNDLITTLHTEITQAIMRGDAPDRAIDTIARKFKVAKSKAGRLVMTESAYFASASQKDCFKELDVERFEIVATLDSHTSELCQSMDGVVQDMKDFEPGVTAPPFHPWCRTTTVPYFDDDFGERAARDADGNTYYVPSNMTYKEWKNGFVDGDKSGLEQIVPEPIKNEPKFIPAKTIEEAEVFAKRFTNNVSYKGLSLDNANSINERMGELFDKYSLDKLESVSANGSKGIMSSNHHNLNINGKSLGKTLNDFHANFLNSQEETKKSISIMTEQFKGRKIPPVIQKNIDKLQGKLNFKRWSIIDSYDNKVGVSTTHEFGHILADQFFGHVNGVSANPNYNTNPLLKETVAKVQNVFEKAITSGDIYKISEYASNNSYEFFAECFTMREYGESLPDYIEDMMNEVLTNGKL